MSNILSKLILSGKLDLYLSETEKSDFLKRIQAIKTKYLYESAFHGLHHSEKVCLFAYLIGRHYKLNSEQMKILLDAALYHDVGRMDDKEDQLHGYSSTLRFAEIFATDPFYHNKTNLEILKAISDAHSVPDKRIEKVLGNYELGGDSLNTAKMLAELLKDADAVDRTRFQKSSGAALKTCYLRTDIAKELVQFSYQVNAYYRLEICEETFETYANLSSGPLITCMHGIGFNFGTFEGILDSGILSAYAKFKENKTSTRNFNGNNGSNWISVCVGDGEAKKQFVDSGIAFECSASGLISGEKNYSMAKSKGLPVASKHYQDERFAFYKIGLENILKIRINPLFLGRDISTLNYFIGSLNYDAICDNINAYLTYMRLNLGFFPSLETIEKLKQQFYEAVIKYERLEAQNQKEEQTAFLASLDNLKLKINTEIASMLKKAYARLFKKDDVTLLEVVTHILNKKKIEYTYNDGEFSLRQLEKQIS